MVEKRSHRGIGAAATLGAAIRSRIARLQSREKIGARRVLRLRRRHVCVGVCQKQGVGAQHNNHTGIRERLCASLMAEPTPRLVMMLLRELL